MANGRRATGAAALPIIGSVFLALALLLLLGAGGLVAAEQWAGHDATAEGVVVEAGQRPRVRFVAGSGEAVTFRARVRAGFRETGDRVPVAYAPGTPQDAVIDTLLHRWTLPVILGIIGGVFLCAGIGLCLIGRLLNPR